MSYHFSKTATTASQIYFRFGDVSHLRRSKTICLPNFDKLSQSTAEIKDPVKPPRLKYCSAEILLPLVLKQPPYWNSASRFHSDLSSSSACDFASRTKFYPNVTINYGVTTWYRFSKSELQHRKSTSGFQFGDVSRLRRPKTVCIWNFLLILVWAL